MEKTVLSPEIQERDLSLDFDDTWVLHQRVKYYKIQFWIQLLFDKVLMEIEHGESLQKKEAKVTVYKQARSRFYFLNITYHGKRIRLSSRCELKKDAQKLGVILLSKLMQKENFPGSINYTEQTQENAPVFEKASFQYIQEECKGKKIAWKREDLCHRDLLSFFGKYHLNEITPQLISRWMHSESSRIVRGNKTISARSVNYNLGYLKRFFNYAMNIQEWIKENPASKIKPLPISRKENRVLSEEEESKLLNACKHPWFERVIVFAIETGLRVGEIANLKTKDFHLDYGIPHFRIQREKNKVITEFPLASERLSRIIKEQMSYQHEDEHFFVDDKGMLLNIDKMGKRLEKTAQLAGIEKITFNILRKTFCSRLNWLGCNKMFVEYLMGHTVKGIESHYLANNLKGVYEELLKIEDRNKKNVIPLSYLSENKEKICSL
jgi:integrase